MRSRSHLGTSFAVWSGRYAWFWFVLGPGCNRAAVGAAANEAEAIHEARSSIEEMSARANSGELDAICKTPAPAISLPLDVNSAAIGWNESLASLDQYLSRLRCEKSCRRSFE